MPVFAYRAADRAGRTVDAAQVAKKWRKYRDLKIEADPGEEGIVHAASSPMPWRTSGEGDAPTAEAIQRMSACSPTSPHVADGACSHPGGIWRIMISGQSPRHGFPG